MDSDIKDFLESGVPHEQESGVPKAPAVNGTLFTIAINGMFDDIETSVEKCLYVHNLALSYLAKATARSSGKCKALQTRCLKIV